MLTGRLGGDVVWAGELVEAGGAADAGLREAPVEAEAVGGGEAGERREGADGAGGDGGVEAEGVDGEAGIGGGDHGRRRGAGEGGRSEAGWRAASLGLWPPNPGSCPAPHSLPAAPHPPNPNPPSSPPPPSPPPILMQKSVQRGE